MTTLQLLRLGYGPPSLPLRNCLWTTIAITREATECFFLCDLFVFVVILSSRWEDLASGFLLFFHVFVQYILDEILEVDDTFLVVWVEGTFDVGVHVEAALDGVAQTDVFVLHLFEERVHRVEIFLRAVLVPIHFVLEFQRRGGFGGKAGEVCYAITEPLLETSWMACILDTHDINMAALGKK